MEFISTLHEGHIRIYQLDFKIKNCATGIKTIAERKIIDVRLNPQWVIDEDVSESVDKIAISDAHTHIERLVFPAFWIKNTETGERKVCWDRAQIDGSWTMMIHGGDESTVHEPKVYERHLRSIQK